MPKLQFPQTDRIASGVAVVTGNIVELLAKRPRAQRRLITVLCDSILNCIAGFLALYLRTGEFFWLGGPLYTLFAASLIFWFPVAWWHRIYSSLLRFSGGRAVFTLLRAFAFYALAMAILFMVITIPGVPRTMGFLQPIVFLLLVLFVRFAAQFAFTEILGKRRTAGHRKRVAIYGAGRAGQQLANALRLEPQIELVMFVDDDERLHNQTLNGVPIFANGDHTQHFKSVSVDEVLLAIPSAPRQRRLEVAEYLSQLQLKVRSLPSVGGIIDGKVEVSDLREVRIEDLLGREAVPPNPELLLRNVKGKRVLVTGAGGSIGSELCRQIFACEPSALILVENSEFALYRISEELAVLGKRENVDVEIAAELCDVGNRQAIDRTIRRLSPETIFHAAAYKHVPLIEENPSSGMRNNIFGTLNTVLAAERHGTENFTLISTDKAVRPTNIMGASKRVCEMILQSRANEVRVPRFSIVRFGNVLGSSGSVVPKFTKQIADGGPVTITDKRITRYFMTIPEAAQLVIQAGSMAQGGEVFFLEMGNPVKIVDLATAMIHLSGLSEKSSANPAGDIEIHEIGLRPGEKLYEELLLGNAPEPTAHPRISKGMESFIEWSDLSEWLERFCARHSRSDLLQLLREVVPEFNHQDGQTRDLTATSTSLAEVAHPTAY